MEQNESDIAAGIVPEDSPRHIEPLRNEFQAWHRVRKQFIRKHQWNELARRNVKDAWRAELQKPSLVGKQSHMHVLQPLKCLVIPGNHLLDMRSLLAELGPLDCFVRYLGFNEGQGSGEIGTEVHVANNSVTSIASVLPDSMVLRDRFETIAGEDSLAFSELKKYGPFHIVNLDLCGSMFPNTVAEVGPYYSAMDRLLKYQFATQKTNWLLFLTTMVEPGLMDQSEMTRLCQPVHDNLAAHTEFGEKLATLLPKEALEGANSSSSAIDFAKLSEENLVDLFGVAFGKWLVKMGQAASPRWTVGMRRSYSYSIKKEKGAVMLSLAFEMTPNIAPPIDLTGMSRIVTASKVFPSEVEIAGKLVVSVASMEDVEDLFLRDPALMASLRDEAAELMKSAGFDPVAYVKWVEAGEVCSPG